MSTNSNPLSFIGNMQLVEVAPTSSGARSPKKDRNPSDAFMGIRIFKDGSVYPSKALTDSFNLEYQQAVITVEKTATGKDKKLYEYPNSPGNGFDVWDTKQWANQYKEETRLLVVAIVPKTEAKVDLFAGTKYDDDGSPKSSVLDQGASTFGATMLPLLKEIYGIDTAAEDFEHTDLAVAVSADLSAASPNGIFLIPKEISRGANKGQMEYIRRENVKIFPLVPAAWVETQEEEEEEEEESVIVEPALAN
jgi:hypothetical protein